jgi:hypothetical protein
VPSMRCRCGEILRYGDIPCPIEWLFVSDVAYDKFAANIDAEELYKAMHSFLKCPRCGRLWCFWEGFAKPPTEYVPAG